MNTFSAACVVNEMPYSAILVLSEYLMSTSHEEACEAGAALKAEGKSANH
jgi:hypothetical protein